MRRNLCCNIEDCKPLVVTTSTTWASPDSRTSGIHRADNTPTNTDHGTAILPKAAVVQSASHTKACQAHATSANRIQSANRIVSNCIYQYVFAISYPSAHCLQTCLPPAPATTHGSTPIASTLPPLLLLLLQVLALRRLPLLLTGLLLALLPIGFLLLLLRPQLYVGQQPPAPASLLRVLLLLLARKGVHSICLSRLPDLLLLACQFYLQGLVRLNLAPLRLPLCS